MAEPIIEQIADWIKTAIHGTQDPDAMLTMRAVRPTILDWDVSHFAHADVIIEAAGMESLDKRTTASRKELGTWMLYGIIRTLAANTAVDTVMSRLAETIRRTMLAGNANGQACGGLALNIDCPNVEYAAGEGCAAVIVTVNVTYITALADGYTAP